MRGVNLPREPVPHQCWKISGMVEVGVSQAHGVDGAGFHREPAPVAEAKLLQSLEEPAVKEYPLAVLLQQESRSGDGARASEE